MRNIPGDLVNYWKWTIFETNTAKKWAQIPLMSNILQMSKNMNSSDDGCKIKILKLAFKLYTLLNKPGKQIHLN